MRSLVELLPGAALDSGTVIKVVRDVGHLVRAQLEAREGKILELDVVHEPVADIAVPPPPIEGIVVESLADLRASKLTCILSRSEPRDLVDLYFLDKAGFPPERDLGMVVRKDSGIDPGVLACLLAQFPVSPLPDMLAPLTTDELVHFRNDLAQRMRSSVIQTED
jgi:hypothetical protein